jgi:hypothetical protein
LDDLKTSFIEEFKGPTESVRTRLHDRLRDFRYKRTERGPQGAHRFEVLLKEAGRDSSDTEFTRYFVKSLIEHEGFSKENRAALKMATSMLLQDDDISFKDMKDKLRDIVATMTVEPVPTSTEAASVTYGAQDARLVPYKLPQPARVLNAAQHREELARHADAERSRSRLPCTGRHPTAECRGDRFNPDGSIKAWLPKKEFEQVLRGRGGGPTYRNQQAPTPGPIRHDRR